MSKRLPVPPGLEHLIEKREEDSDRRASNKRRSSERREADLGPVGAIESAKDIDDVPTEDAAAGSSAATTRIDERSRGGSQAKYSRPILGRLPWPARMAGL